MVHKGGSRLKRVRSRTGDQAMERALGSRSWGDP